MTRTYDQDRTPGDKACTIASRRTARLDGPMERHRFMAAYQLGRRFAETGRDSYIEFRRMLEADDSVGLAGLIEGESSIRKPGNLTLDQVMPYYAGNHKWVGPSPVDENEDRKLSGNERDALIGAASGHPSGRTAADLGVSQNAVNMALHRARKKLGATTTAQAVVMAMNEGQITMREIKRGMAS